MNPVKIAKIALATLAIAATGFTARATTLDLGTSWDAANLPSEVIGLAAGAGHSTETQIADLINSFAGTTFGAADILKTNQPDLTTNALGQIVIGGGWDFLAIQYDGPNGGSVVIALNGMDALAPWLSYNIWGGTDQYSVSHISVAGPHASVPDSGATVALLGLGLAATALVRRKIQA
jgi:hypothetical protein